MNQASWVYAVVFSFIFLGGDAIAAGAPEKSAAPAAANPFPHRTSFPDVPIISTADLATSFDRLVTVDVRSHYEYETLRIKDALNVPVTDKTFVDKVKALRAQHAGKSLVFYCNGKTCKKSYDAARLAVQAEIKDVLCFDAGIEEWSKTNPQRTALLGRSPITPTDLITGDQFKARVISATDFEKRIGATSLVLDIRDVVQRDIAVFPFREERVPLDQKERLDAVVERAKSQNKTLLVYDKAGHQIKWFQYYLESKGLKNYYFLKGGEEGYYASTLGVKMGLNK